MFQDHIFNYYQNQLLMLSTVLLDKNVSPSTWISYIIISFIVTHSGDSNWAVFIIILNCFWVMQYAKFKDETLTYEMGYLICYLVSHEYISHYLCFPVSLASLIVLWLAFCFFIPFSFFFPFCIHTCTSRAQRTLLQFEATCC